MIASKNVKIGLFVGRFQPFHLGHLSAIRQALAQVDFLVIGIGSSQYSGTPDNPFTAAERRAMIEGSLRDEGNLESRYRIVEIPDIHDDAKWPGHVRSIAGDFNVVFTGSALVRELFKKYDKTKIRTIKFEVDISATHIREQIRGKGNWQKNLSKAAVRIVSKRFL